MFNHASPRERGLLKRRSGSLVVVGAIIPFLCACNLRGTSRKVYRHTKHFLRGLGTRGGRVVHS